MYEEYELNATKKQLPIDPITGAVLNKPVEKKPSSLVFPSREEQVVQPVVDVDTEE